MTHFYFAFFFLLDKNKKITATDMEAQMCHTLLTFAGREKKIVPQFYIKYTFLMNLNNQKYINLGAIMIYVDAKSDASLT